MFITPQLETMENYATKNYYDLFLKIGVLLLAHMLRNLKANPEILLNKISFDFLKLEQKVSAKPAKKNYKKDSKY